MILNYILLSILLPCPGAQDTLSIQQAIVTGEKPVVKVEKSKFIYDLPRMLEKTAVDNAYDALKELPGVTEQDGTFSLSGRPVKVAIDGKVTTMTQEQLNTLLRSTPAGRIKSAEVTYNAPARYHVRGAIINLRLTHDGPSALQGEGALQWKNQRKSQYEQRANLLYSSGKFSADMIYSHTHGKNLFLTNTEAKHYLNDGSIYDIVTDATTQSNGFSHNFRLGADWNFSENHGLSAVYCGIYSRTRMITDTRGNVIAQNDSKSRNILHNGRLDYKAPFGLGASLELTWYKAPGIQTLTSTINNDREYAFDAKDSQKISRWKATLSQEHNLKNGWGINYGAVFSTSLDVSWQQYSAFESVTGDFSGTTGADTGSGSSSQKPQDMDSRQRESTFNLYAGFNKNFNNRFIIDASIAAEYYDSPAWKKCDFYPVANFTWLPAAGHIVQLTLDSGRNYPEYWAVKEATIFSSGGYSEIVGNPALKPSGSYNMQLVYVLKSKYTFAAWYNYTDDYFVQTYYQSPERLASIIKWVNFDFQQQAGFHASIPFSIGKWLSSRATLTGVWMREKDSDWHDLPFDRQICYGMATLNNNITLCSNPDILLNIKGMIRSKAIQGLYDLPGSGSVDVSLRYRFLKGRAALKLWCNDIFETAGISPRMNYSRQIVINRHSSFREFGISFTCSFGGYTEKKRSEVDTSRFKK